MTQEISIAYMQSDLYFNPVKSMPSLFYFRQNNKEIYNHDSNRKSLFEAINSHEIINFLRKDGFCIGINLPEFIVQEILEFAMNTPCHGNANPNLGFYYPNKKQVQDKYEKKLSSAIYANSDLLCPALKKLQTDPKLLEIAAMYLKAEPIHLGNRLWWSFPVESTIYERRRAVQIFHHEPYERRFLKFFFYLTDVDLCSSPHVCVRGSHIKKKLSHRLLHTGHSHSEIAKSYGYKNIVPICGRAGFGFVEDTACFHKETSPGSKDRLILEIKFAVKDAASASGQN